MGQKKQTGYLLPRGVTIRQNKTKDTLVITFTYKGVLCREPLSRLTIDNKNIKYAERLLAEIQNNIEKGTFSYPKYFPNSKKLILFGVNNREKRVIDYLEEYLVICET